MNDQQLPRITLGRRLWRGFLGLCLGWFVVNVTCLLWCGVGIIWAGDIEVALQRLKVDRTSNAIFGSIFAGMPSSVLGAVIATVAIGHSRLRYPTVTSGLIAGGLSSLCATILGGFVTYTIYPTRPPTPEYIWLPALIVLPVSIIIGWWVGRRCTSVVVTAPLSADRSSE